MEKTILISLPIEDLQTLIIDCVNTCLKYEEDRKVQHTQKNKELLTINEAAEYLSLATQTIYGLVNRSKIPFMKKGKRLYFSTSELKVWVKSGNRQQD